MNGTPLAARIVVVMGVASSGTSVTGSVIASRLSAPFLDGDDFHPQANKDKMRAGTPLDDADRWPWLATLARALRNCVATHGLAVGACSALKRGFRDYLVAVAGEPILFVYLAGTPDLFAGRIAARRHEFMPASLLASQFAILEVPAPDENALAVAATLTPSAIAERVALLLGTR